MRLRAGRTIKYGIPYQGSKTKIVEKIARFLPNADNFYDLFGGGFSVSHYMMLHRKNSYKHFHFNEIRPGVCDLIRDAIAGKYNYDTFKPKWVSREDFFKNKEHCAYTKIIWSFGNNGETYLFGKDLEDQKRSMHQACVFNEFDEFMRNTFKISCWPNDLTITGKRLYLKRICSSRVDLQQLEQLERLQQLERLEFYCCDYRSVEIKPNSIVYCDIPYQGTADYGSQFNHNEFFDWADRQVSPVFVSEYEVEDDRFKLLLEIKHRSIFSKEKNNSATKERLYCNKQALKLFKYG